MKVDHFVKTHGYPKLTFCMFAVGHDTPGSPMAPAPPSLQNSLGEEHFPIEALLVETPPNVTDCVAPRVNRDIIYIYIYIIYNGI